MIKIYIKYSNANHVTSLNKPVWVSMWWLQFASHICKSGGNITFTTIPCKDGTLIAATEGWLERYGGGGSAASSAPPDEMRVVKLKMLCFVLKLYFVICQIYVFLTFFSSWLKFTFFWSEKNFVVSVIFAAVLQSCIFATRTLVTRLSKWSFQWCSMIRITIFNITKYFKPEKKCLNCKLI